MAVSACMRGCWGGKQGLEGGQLEGGQLTFEGCDAVTLQEGSASL